MSYSIWTVDGYGICTDEIKTSVEKIEKLINLAPKFATELAVSFETDCIVPTYETYEEMEDECDCIMGLAYILQSVIYEKENIRFDTCDDYNGVKYLLFLPFYPWTVATKEELVVSKEGIDKLINKYVSILTDETIKVDYYSVENGG